MEDKRITKTRHAIYNAFYNLYLNKNMEDITVTELANAAGIGRKTFYLHYSSVDDVVNDVINRIWQRLSENCQKNEQNNVSSKSNRLNKDLFYESFKKNFYAYETHARSIVKKDTDSYIAKKFNDILRAHISDGILVLYDVSKSENNYYSDFISTTIVILFRKWIIEDMTMSLDDLKKTIDNCILFGLNGMRGR